MIELCTRIQNIPVLTDGVDEKKCLCTTGKDRVWSGKEKQALGTYPCCSVNYFCGSGHAVFIFSLSCSVSYFTPTFPALSHIAFTHSSLPAAKTSVQFTSFLLVLRGGLL